jgi:hypothetical protein
MWFDALWWWNSDGCSGSVSSQTATSGIAFGCGDADRELLDILGLMFEQRRERDWRRGFKRGGWDGMMER